MAVAPARKLCASIVVGNPSNYPRGGYVSAKLPDGWRSAIAKHAFALSLRESDGDGPSLPLQIDFDIVPGRPECHLATILTREIPPGKSIGLRLGDTGVPTRMEHTSSDAWGQQPRIELFNRVLFASLSLTPSQLPGDAACFAGSAQSVRLSGREMLEAFHLTWRGHHPEKRCMQVNQIRLYHNGSFCTLFEPFRSAYRVASLRTGAVRTLVLLASAPFRCSCTNSPEYRLYRLLSIWMGDAPFIEEELFIDPPVHFSARCFVHMDAGMVPETYSEENWLVIGYNHGDPQTQCPGYGFGTNLKASPIRNPHPGFCGDRPERTFSWSLEPATSAQCVHVFMRAGDFEHTTGSVWHERIVCPLTFELA